MADLHIPATPAFLRGYCGPALIRPRVGDGLEPEFVDCGPRGPRMSWAGRLLLLEPDCGVLDASLGPVRDHVARVMSAGVRCPACDPENYPGRKSHCYRCSGTGYLLRPAPIEHLLDRPGSRLTAEQSAVPVAWSARSWLRGGPVIVAVMSEPIAPGRGMDRSYRHSLSSSLVAEVGDIYVSRHNYRQGWRIGIAVHERMPSDEDIASGPETGPEGRACADRALLAANIAYLNEGSVVTPEEPDHV